MNYSNDFYDNYYRLTELFKDKSHASSVKLDEVIILLNYFNENINNLSENELKLYRNILIMAKALAYTANTFRITTQAYVKEINEMCNNISIKLKK